MNLAPYRPDPDVTTARAPWLWSGWPVARRLVYVLLVMAPTLSLVGLIVFGSDVLLESLDEGAACIILGVVGLILHALGALVLRDLVFKTGPRTLLAVWWPVTWPALGVLRCGRWIARGGEWLASGDDPWSSS
jgi:hypothetical protein